MIQRVAIQGDRASFHELAARKFYGPGIELICCKSFKETFEAVTFGSADSAICAIENSLFGSINETYDLLVKTNFSIIGEIYLRIVQCLIVNPGIQLRDIKNVYSHPVALAQCQEYLDKELPNAKRLEFHDTAASVEMIKSTNSQYSAAIASAESSKLYEMEILANEIETNKQNYTRFVVLEPKTQKITGSNKTTLIIKTSHKPGALYKALGVFAKRSINLSKLQSRPIIGKPWHYMFYLDIECGFSDQRLIEALDELAVQGCEVKLLGSYKSGNKV